MIKVEEVPQAQIELFLQSYLDGGKSVADSAIEAGITEDKGEAELIGSALRDTKLVERAAKAAGGDLLQTFTNRNANLLMAALTNVVASPFAFFDNVDGKLRLKDDADTVNLLGQAVESFKYHDPESGIRIEMKMSDKSKAINNLRELLKEEEERMPRVNKGEKVIMVNGKPLK